MWIQIYCFCHKVFQRLLPICTGHVTIIPWENRRYFNTEWYRSICLPTACSEKNLKTKTGPFFITSKLTCMQHVKPLIIWRRRTYIFTTFIAQWLLFVQCYTTIYLNNDYSHLKKLLNLWENHVLKYQIRSEENVNKTPLNLFTHEFFEN